MLNVLATIIIHADDIPGPKIDFNGPGTNGLLIVLGWIFGILLIVCLAGGGVSAALIGIGRAVSNGQLQDNGWKGLIGCLIGFAVFGVLVLVANFVWHSFGG